MSEQNATPTAADDSKVTVGPAVHIEMIGGKMTPGTAVYEEGKGAGAFSQSDVYFPRGQFLGEKLLKALGNYSLDSVPTGVVISIRAVGPAVDVRAIRPASKRK